MHRFEELAKLRALQANLRKLGVEPALDEDVVATFNKRQLRAAVKIFEEELLDATRKLAEE
jgi:hypothetical protein